jgi:FKBP-type peptidyl-prolyl cis-trans isomerase FklB
VELNEAEQQLLLRGLRDYTADKAQMSLKEASTAIRAYQQEAWKELSAKNEAEGKAFLEKNKARKGVVTLPSGLQYEVLREGAGVSPKPNDKVTVQYRGTFIDGKEFDSSYKRGQPATFAVKGVIKGWTEALQLMKPGAKWKLYVPANLAYGSRGMRPAIGPNKTLIFEIELLRVQSASPASTTQVKPKPVTSDIIKVPSREEMAKGAKVEIIKAAELEKYKQKGTQNGQAQKKTDQPKQ